MSDFYSILELAHIKAIQASIEPTLTSLYRMKCREFSQAFNVPLDRVENELMPDYILQHLYEMQYPPQVADEEMEELLEKLYKIKDPKYSRMTQEETESLVDAVLNREIARMKKKKAPTQQTIQNEIIAAEKSIPKSGGMDFSSLEKEESQQEHNTKGFKD